MIDAKNIALCYDCEYYTPEGCDEYVCLTVLGRK